MGLNRKMVVFCIVVASWAMATSVATVEEDEKDCADQLANLASCIPFVSGSAKKPTPECCQDTKKVKAAKPKCLCILIKESTDPSLGLPVNTTLALQMPSACNIDAKVSDCPTILNLPPDSPDAKIFKEGGDQGSATASATNSPTSSSSSSSSTSSATDAGTSSSNSVSKATPSSNNGAKVKAALMGGNWLVVMVMAAIAWMFI